MTCIYADGLTYIAMQIFPDLLNGQTENIAVKLMHLFFSTAEALTPIMVVQVVGKLLAKVYRREMDRENNCKGLFPC